MLLSILLLPAFTMTLYSSPPTQPQGDTQTDIRIMCFNIRFGTADDGPNAWPKRRSMLVETIRAFEPDLLGTQEVLASQADELRAALPGYGFVGVGRDDGRHSGEMSPIYYRTERFEKLDEGHVWLSPTPDVPGSKGWDSNLPRLATYVLLRDRRHGDRQVFFINTHWDHVGTRARMESAKIIRRTIEPFVRDGVAVVVAGDLNCTEDSDAYAALLRGTAEPDEGEFVLTDTYRQARGERLTDEATFHAFQGTVAGSRIDFIFHTDAFTTLDAGIDRTNRDGRYPSDHYPVTAVIRPGPAGNPGPPTQPDSRR